MAEVTEVRLAPQPLGAQPAVILAELGYGEEDIAKLAAEGTIRIQDSG